MCIVFTPSLPSLCPSNASCVPITPCQVYDLFFFNYYLICIPLSVVHVQMCLGLSNLPGGASIENTDSPSPNSWECLEALPLGSCEISPIHAGMSAGVAIVKVC